MIFLRRAAHFAQSFGIDARPEQSEIADVPVHFAASQGMLSAMTMALRRVADVCCGGETKIEIALLFAIDSHSRQDSTDLNSNQAWVTGLSFCDGA